MKNSPSEANQKLLHFFSCLADETRLNIILAVSQKPKTVSEIHAAVGKSRKNKITLSAISHQLRLLSDAGALSYEKNGKEKRFDLSEEFCWCMLKDIFRQFNKKVNFKCKKCLNKRNGVK